ncbi:MAG: hypothetical protein GY751_08925, partial [Bacteroidetes bacterium]|nr:hypothetical protein [Bacteroidota bacterium]
AYASLDLRGNGSTSRPSLPYHQPGRYAHVLSMGNDGVLDWTDGSGAWKGIRASSYVVGGRTASQFLKADCRVDSNAYVTIYHDHSYVRTGDYRDRNPVGFSNQTFTPFFLSGSKIGTGSYYDAMYLNTYSDNSGGKTNLIAMSKQNGRMYRMMVDQGAAAWNGTLVEMLDTNNWQSTIDGRYLLLTGGILSGPLSLNGNRLQTSPNTYLFGSDGYHQFNTSYGNIQIGPMNEGYAHIYTDRPNFYFNKALKILGHDVWHAGNDGTGSGLDADMLDGFHETSFFREGIGSYSVADVESTTANIGRRTGSYQISHDGYSSSLLSFNTGGSAAWFQLWKTSYGNGGELRYRTSVDQELSQPWKTLIDEGNIQYVNAGSATKLQTARLIYGQHFDGTSNISGKAFVDQRMSGVATVSLAIGDTDTGFDWLADGVYKLKSNGGDVAQVSQDRFHLYKKLVIESNEGNYREGIRIKASSPNWVTIALGAIGEAGTSENMWSIHRTADNNFAIARNDSSGVNGMFIGKNGNVGFGTVSPTCKMEIHGAIKAVNGGIETNHSVYAGDAVYAGGRIFTGFDSGYSGSISCSNWFRGNGATGWINETYGGGIYMVDSEQVRVYGNKVLYNDGSRVWGIGGHKCGLKLYADDNIGINLANSTYTWGIYANNDGNMYIGRRSGNVNDSSGSYYLTIGAGTMTYNGSIVLNGGGLITYSSDIRLKEIQEYFKPSLNELADLPIFAHSWRNGTPGVQLSTSAQAVQKIMPWNVFEGDDGYLKMDGTRTALAVSIRLAQLANEYITENERWKSDKDRQIEALQREVQSLKQQLNVA